VPGVLIDTTATGISGLPASIDSVIPLPKPDVWNRMLEILESGPAEASPQANNLGPIALDIIETRPPSHPTPVASLRPEYI
jgi:hypothetical protein